MDSILYRLIWKRSICLIAFFIAYQFLQVNTYSNENHDFELNKPEQNNSPIFLKLKNDLFVGYAMNPFYHESSLEEKLLNPTKKIYSSGVLNKIHLANFLNDHNSQIPYLDVLQFASDYIRQCEIEGINHDIAFAQMCLETGFLKFGGSVSADQNNFCGLGAVNKNTAGESFKSKKIGVIAHVQHLKAYVSKDKLNSPLVDARFKYVKRGSVKTINDLTGKWATDPKYGEKIESLLHRMYSI